MEIGIYCIFSYLPHELMLKISLNYPSQNMSLNKFYLISNSVIFKKLMLKKKESDKITTIQFQIGEHFFSKGLGSVFAYVRNMK